MHKLAMRQVNKREKKITAKRKIENYPRSLRDSNPGPSANTLSVVPLRHHVLHGKYVNLSASYPGAYMKYSGRQPTREGAVGKGVCWGAPGSSCILSWRENMEFNTKSYHIVIYSVCKTLLCDDELN